MRISFEAPPSFPVQPWSLRTFMNNMNQCAKPNVARTDKDVRTGRVEPKAPEEYEDGEVKL